MISARTSAPPRGGRASRFAWLSAAAWLAFASLVCLPAASRANAAPAAGSSADSAANEVVVATRVVPPFVIEDGAGKLTGFSIDLWRAIAAEVGVKTSFETFDNLPDLLEALRRGEDPVGISAISITAERERTLEFSQPMFRSGLQIMVPAGESGAQSALRAIFSPVVFKTIAIVLAVLLVPAHVAWLIHRFEPESNWPISRSYWPGIAESFYWSAEKMIGTASGAPGGAFGRAFNNVWSFLCVMVLASLTALIASALTLSSLRTDIHGPNDLSGKRIATVRGSTAAAYLHDLGASVSEYDDFTAAVAALDPGKSAASGFSPVALVYDAPIILYFINQDDAHRFVAVGAPFRAENYGIAFPLDSDLRHRVNRALLKLSEDGTYDQIAQKWFGKSGQK